MSSIGDILLTTPLIAGAAEDEHDARRLALPVKLGLQRVPLEPAVARPLSVAWKALVAPGTLGAVRSSALIEDTPSTSFAGQFDTFLGIANETDLVTAVGACWAALWATRALRYMRTQGVNAAETAMAVLVQRLVPAQASGGALSEAPGGEVLLTGTWGLGTAVAQGEVVPDRYVVRRDASRVEIDPGYLVTTYPDATIADVRTTPPTLVRITDLTVDDFTVAKVTEDVGETSKNRVTQAIEGFLINSFYNLAIGQDDQAIGYTLLAQKVWSRFMDQVGEQAKRVGLPPFPDMEQEALRVFESEYADVVVNQFRAKKGLPPLTNAPAATAPAAATNAPAATQP